MNSVEIIAVIVIVLVVGSAVAYIIKQKKSSGKCIGCPFAKECGIKQSGGCNDEHFERQNL